MIDHDVERLRLRLVADAEREGLLDVAYRRVERTGVGFNGDTIRFYLTSSGSTVADARTWSSTPFTTSFRTLYCCRAHPIRAQS